MAAFSYCLHHYPSHNQLKRWASLCYNFYEVEILYSNDPTIQKIKKEAILESSIFLINSDKIINYLYSVSSDIMTAQEIIDVFLLT
jgi:hypothetical protein